jgi:hypothetical protein
MPKKIMKEQLNYDQALQALKNGEKVKLPEWVGYWFRKRNSTEIFVHDRFGNILQTPFLEDYRNRTDWEITDGSRDFGGAILALKAGKLVARQGWNGKGMFIFMRPADTLTAGTLINKVKSIPESVKKHFNSLFSHSEKEEKAGLGPENVQVNFTAYLCMKAADGSIVNGWLASQTDILAEDWEIVE